MKKADYASKYALARAKAAEARSAFHAHQRVSALTAGWEERYHALYARLREAQQEADRAWNEARRAGVALDDL